MENYFDVATPEELEEHYGEKPTAEEISEDRQRYLESPDLNYQHLYWLYLDRGEKDKAAKQLAQIQDPEMRLCATMAAYECED